METGEVITGAREILSDLDKDRWADERLINLLNNGLLDLAMNTNLFTSKKYVELQNNVRSYDFSEVAVRILRVQYLEKVLPFKTLEEMDSQNISWETVTGDTPKAIIINKQNRSNFTVYPEPLDVPGEGIEFPEAYGIVTSFTYAELDFADVYGDIASITIPGLIVSYSEKQPKVETLVDVVTVDEFAKVALEHYIAGFAFRDNMDAQNRQMGAEEIALYSTLMNKMKEEKSKNFTQTSYYTEYQGI